MVGFMQFWAINASPLWQQTHHPSTILEGVDVIWQQALSDRSGPAPISCISATARDTLHTSAFVCCCDCCCILLLCIRRG